jgi:hypothetical protein
MNGYFAYDPESDYAKPGGLKNWTLLRQYLAAANNHIRSEGTEPEWVLAIGKHTNLLAEEPCKRYSRAMLDGDTAEFEWVKSKLELSDSSWLTRQVVLSQMLAATKLTDSEFCNKIASLLNLLEKHPFLINSALPMILNRYQQCSSPVLNPELRDFSVACWGNPVLSSSQMSWSLVTPTAREMVADWLKLYLIHQFFSLLAQDGQNDTRRLRFWQRYYKNIRGVHFALGNSAMHNYQADFRKIREQAKGQILTLHSAGAPENNAFIMTFENHVVIEFGMHGNACFVFRKNQLPFTLTGMVAGDKTELKHDSRVWRGRHQDTNYYRTWENQFDLELAQIIGCRAGRTDDLPIGASVQTARSNVKVQAPQQVGTKQPPFQLKPSGVVSPTARDERTTFFGNPSPPAPIVSSGASPAIPQVVAHPGTHQSVPIVKTNPNAQSPSADMAKTIHSLENGQPDRVKIVAKPSPPSLSQSSNDNQLRAWCEFHRFPCNDLRAKGGNLWIETGALDMAINKQLRDSGFKYKDDKGWWRKR